MIHLWRENISFKAVPGRASPGRDALSFWFSWRSVFTRALPPRASHWCLLYAAPAALYATMQVVLALFLRCSASRCCARTCSRCLWFYRPGRRCDAPRVSRMPSPQRLRPFSAGGACNITCCARRLLYRTYKRDIQLPLRLPILLPCLLYRGHLLHDLFRTDAGRAWFAVQVSNLCWMMVLCRCSMGTSGRSRCAFRAYARPPLRTPHHLRSRALLLLLTIPRPSAPSPR